MVDLEHLVWREAREVLLYLRQQLLARKDLVVLLRGDGVEQERRPVGRVVKSVGNLVDIAQLKPGFRQTVVNRANREVSLVLFPAKPLLGGSGNQFAVDNQHRSGVMPLRNAILALFQSGPAGLFERNGIFESTDAQDLRHYPRSPSLLRVRWFAEKLVERGRPRARIQSPK